MLKELNKEIIKKRMNEVLEGGDILKVRDDRTFKALWNENDMEAVTWLVSGITKRPISELKGKIEVLNNELKPLNMHDKKKTVDFIVNLDDTAIIIELNNNDTGRDYTRNLLYTFHALLNKIERGEKYRHLHGYLINLNWWSDKYKNLKDMQRIQEVRYPYPEIGKEDEAIVIVKNINLSIYDKMRYNEVGKEEFLWKLFTINNSKDLENIKTSFKELSIYCNELESLSRNEEYCMFVWSERIEKNLSGIADYNDGVAYGEKIGMEKGKKLGQDEGIKEGIAQKERELVINMHNDNVPIESIIKYANITEDKVLEIINSQ